jgi:hypothetical protein
LKFIQGEDYGKSLDSVGISIEDLGIDNDKE